MFSGSARTIITPHTVAQRRFSPHYSCLSSQTVSCSSAPACVGREAERQCEQITVYQAARDNKHTYRRRSSCSATLPARKQQTAGTSRWPPSSFCLPLKTRRRLRRLMTNAERLLNIVVALRNDRMVIRFIQTNKNESFKCWKSLCIFKHISIHVCKMGSLLILLNLHVNNHFILQLSPEESVTLIQDYDQFCMMQFISGFTQVTAWSYGSCFTWLIALVINQVPVLLLFYITAHWTSVAGRKNDLLHLFEIKSPKRSNSAKNI